MWTPIFQFPITFEWEGNDLSDSSQRRADVAILWFRRYETCLSFLVFFKSWKNKSISTMNVKIQEQ